MTKADLGTGELLVPAIRGTPVFDANVSHLGRLSAVQVGSVLEAYILLKEFDRSLVLFSTPDRSGHYRVVGAQHARKVGAMLQSLLPDLSAAIAKFDGVQDCTTMRPGH